jgi:putative phosphoesterase
VIIYGHSHLEEINQQSDITILNPGSIALPRNAQRRKSYILIDIENNKIIPQIKY